MKWERPLVPKPRRRSQVQLVRLGLSQVEPRPWVSPTGIPAQGKASRGPGICKGRTDAPVWEGGSQPSEGSLCLQPRPTRKANLGAQPEPLDVRELQPKATLQNLLLSHKGCQRNALFPPGLPSVEGWALQPGEAPSLFGDSYQGSCLCCSSFRLLISATRLNMSRRA